MSKKISLIFVFVLSVLLPIYLTDLTGLHYLFTKNCSSSEKYIPQGPYLFSHHWPFTSLTIQYQRLFTTGTCRLDGSLYFLLNNSIICFGVYHSGQAELFCQFEGDNDYCFIHMETSDGSQLKCYS